MEDRLKTLVLDIFAHLSLLCILISSAYNFIFGPYCLYFNLMFMISPHGMSYTLNNGLASYFHSRTKLHSLEIIRNNRDINHVISAAFYLVSPHLSPQRRNTVVHYTLLNQSSQPNAATHRVLYPLKPVTAFCWLYT